MKKLFIVILLNICFIGIAEPQTLYFDAGVGYSSGNSINVYDAIFTKEKALNNSIFEAGFRSGVLVYTKFPFYVLVDGSCYAGKYMINEDALIFNNYYSGAGIMIYPFSIVQVSASAGCSWVSKNSNKLLEEYYNPVKFAWNSSICFDLGEIQKGVLLGVKYFSNGNIYNKELNGMERGLLLFMRYSYRYKAPIFF